MRTIKEQQDDIIDVLLGKKKRELAVDKKVQARLDREQWFKQQHAQEDQRTASETGYARAVAMIQDGSIRSERLPTKSSRIAEERYP